MFLQENPALPFDVLISTYDLAMVDEAFLSQFRWKYTVFDEAQRIKNSSSVSFKYLIFICNTLYKTPRYSLKFTPPFLLIFPYCERIRYTIFFSPKPRSVWMYTRIYVCLFCISHSSLAPFVSNMEVQLALFGHSVAWMLLFCH